MDEENAGLSSAFLDANANGAYGSRYSPLQNKTSQSVTRLTRKIREGLLIVAAGVLLGSIAAIGRTGDVRRSDPR